MKATRNVLSGQIVILATAFPSMLSPDRQEMIVKDLLAMEIEEADMIEAVKRIKHTRRTTTFPPFAELRDTIITAKADRLKFEQERKDELEREANKPRKLTPVEQEIVHHVHRLGRVHGVYWCARGRRFLDQGEDHKCFPDVETAIPSLTQCKDKLAEAKLKGWRRGESKFGNLAPVVEEELTASDYLAAAVEEPF